MSQPFLAGDRALYFGPEGLNLTAVIKGELRDGHYTVILGKLVQYNGELAQQFGGEVQVSAGCLYPEYPYAVGGRRVGDVDTAMWVHDAYRPITEVCKLRAGLRYVLSQKGDDLCWRDVYTMMASLLPEKDAALATIKSMPAKSVMMHNCDRFTTALCEGRPQEYVADSPETVIDKLQAEIAQLKERLKKYED